MMDNQDTPKLDEQLCFPFYVISKEIIGLMRPYLDFLDLTYSQYLVMIVLWENEKQTVNQIGEKLYLDSGTITPVLKRLEKKKFIIRERKKEDERVVEISLDEAGRNLKSKACEIPTKIKEKLSLKETDIIEIQETINKILNKIHQT